MIVRPTGIGEIMKRLLPGGLENDGLWRLERWFVEGDWVRLCGQIALTTTQRLTAFFKDASVY